MPSPRHLLAAAWLTLLLVASLVSGLPVHVGSASIGGNGHYWRLNLTTPPCMITTPSRSVNDTSPLASYSPPSSLLGSSSPSHFAPRNFRLSELTSRVALTGQTISYTLCKAKPSLIYSRAVFVAYRALFQARAKYWTSYYRTLERRVLISAPPAGTRTTGQVIPPTRARTTSASNPAWPAPAHGWTRGRSCTYEYEATPTPTSPAVMSPVFPTPRSCYRAIRTRLQLADSAFQLWLHRASIWLGIPHALLEVAILTVVYLTAISLVVQHFFPNLAFWTEALEPTGQRVTHYAYELTVEGHRFQTDSLWYQKQWEDSGLYSDYARMERCAWFDIERQLRRFEKKYAGEPFLGVEICLKRRKVVFDIFEDRDGTCAVEIPQDNNSVEIFTNEDHFNFDPNPTSAYTEELADAVPDQTRSGRLGVQY